MVASVPQLVLVKLPVNIRNELGAAAPATGTAAESNPWKVLLDDGEGAAVNRTPLDRAPAPPKVVTTLSEATRGYRRGAFSAAPRAG